MVGIRLLCVLQIGLIAHALSATAEPMKCPDLLNVGSETNFTVRGTTCIYMVDMSMMGYMPCFDNRLDNDPDNHEESQDILYDQLVKLHPGEAISGKGYWTSKSMLYDVYYVAFNASLPHEDVLPELKGISMVEYLLKQYMLTSFINCIPTDFEMREFSCYGGRTDIDGNYVREKKTAYCRTGGLTKTIEHGFDVCTYEKDITRSKVYYYTESVYSSAIAQPGYRRPSRSPVYNELCKLYRNGLDMDSLVGIPNGRCVKRHSADAYDILCCWYGEKAVNYYEDTRNLPGRPIRHACAIASNTIKIDYNEGDPWKSWRKSPRQSVSLPWLDYLRAHLKNVCKTSVRYKFNGNVTEVTQNASVDEDKNRTDCSSPRCTIRYGSARDKTVCPFDQKRNIAEMEVDCCCAGNMCNHVEYDLYGSFNVSQLRAQEEHVALRKTCHVPLAQRQYNLDPLEQRMDRIYMYPSLVPKCMRLWDTAVMKELTVESTSNFMEGVHYEKLYQLTPDLQCRRSEYRLTISVDDYTKNCAHNPDGFIESRRAGIPWFTLDCYCFKRFCDQGNDDISMSIDVTSPLVGHCYDYDGTGSVVPFENRTTLVNWASLFCYMIVTQDDNYVPKYKAGAYNGTSALALYNDFNVTCTVVYEHGQLRNWTCVFNPSLNTTVCCSYYKLSNGAELRNRALESSLLRIEDLKEETRVKCRDGQGFLKTCGPKSIGCYMERPLNTLGFTDSSCLWENEAQNRQSRSRTLCAHQLVNNGVGFCSLSKESESIFCCCRGHEECTGLTITYKAVLALIVKNE